MNCHNCGKDGDNEMRFQEVLTQHIRGVKEQRAQALGEVVSLPLCDSCLIDYTTGQAEKAGEFRKPALGYLAMTVLGAALVLLLPRFGIDNLRIFGVGLMAFGVLGYFQGRKRAQEEQLLARKALEGFGRDRFVESYAATLLPAKAGTSDISYILLRPSLEQMTGTELAQRYRLLPQIALQLKERLASGLLNPPETDTTPGEEVPT